MTTINDITTAGEPASLFLTAPVSWNGVSAPAKPLTAMTATAAVPSVEFTDAAAETLLAAFEAAEASGWHYVAAGVFREYLGMSRGAGAGGREEADLQAMASVAKLQPGLGGLMRDAFIASGFAADAVPGVAMLLGVPAAV